MALNLTEENFDKILHFDTYTGARYTNLRFSSLLDARTVMQLGFDAPAVHQQNIGSLPPGVPNDFRAYRYALFYDVQNNPIYLGVPWVIESSITENENAPFIFTVWGIDNTVADSIRSMMIAHGIEHFTVTRPS